MRSTGTLRLRGEDFQINGWAVRDRSWGEARTESPAGLSGVHWLVAMFDNDYAIHVTGLQDPDTAHWRDRFPEDPARSRAMNRGWVWKDGRLLTVTDVHIDTEWDIPNRRPAAHHVSATDETGNEHRMTGRLRASAHWHTWSNVHMNVGLTRWESDGRIGHGDSQVAMWSDFMRAAFCT